MTASTIAIFAALAVVGFVLSAVFSGLEIGLYTLNRVRLRLRAARGHRAARRLRRELGRSNRVLIVLLLGTNAANYLGTFATAELLHGAGVSDGVLIVLQTTVFALLLFALAETLPKELFRIYTDRWTYALSPLITVARWGFTIVPLLPIVSVFATAVNRITQGPGMNVLPERRRIAQMIKEGLRSGVLNVSQTTLADRALAMNDRTVRSVMVPWSRVVVVPINASRAGRERILRRHGFTRFPVVDARGRVQGVISWLDVTLHPDSPITDYTDDAVTLPADLPLLEATSRLRQMQRAMAIVTDRPDGRPLGLVTLKNLVEPLTGELAAW
ncbi:MAG: DUF21 domain-containing protein [Phycisphaerales bacterium]|nr:DUF21 domain-containing protein [Phycisphaerae bacterium]NNF42026.1 DUF21 domain-containing protein [Phycisphaerales bacterium]NNM25742.1 DUF21 domain-containing protein [Phycisphaerales bacterium]